MKKCSKNRIDENRKIANSIRAEKGCGDKAKDVKNDKKKNKIKKKRKERMNGRGEKIDWKELAMHMNGFRRIT